MIVRELLSDKLLSRYSVVIVDEAHERTLRTDMLLSALKGIQKERNHLATSAGTNDAKGKGTAGKTQNKPLKVVIMSATLDAERFSKFFNKFVFVFIHPFSLFTKPFSMQRQDIVYPRPSASCQNSLHTRAPRRLCRIGLENVLPNPSSKRTRRCLDIFIRYALLSSLFIFY